MNTAALDIHPPQPAPVYQSDRNRGAVTITPEESKALYKAYIRRMADAYRTGNTLMFGTASRKEQREAQKLVESGAIKKHGHVRCE